MNNTISQVLKGNVLFREGEHVCINRSDELKKYCGVMHKHDFIEVAFVAEGKGIHVVGDHEYETSAGDLFIINYDVAHGFFPVVGSTQEPLVINCTFTPEFMDHSLLDTMAFKDISSSFLIKSLFPEDYTSKPDLRLKGIESREIEDIFDKMYKEYRQVKKGYIEMIRAYLIQVLVIIFRNLESYPAITNMGYNNKIIERAMDYLKENYNKDISLEEIALRSFISKNYFSRLFKEVTNINFREYIQRLRIDEACKLLKKTDMKIIDISENVGFKDLKSFYEIFKKFTHATPGGYREKQR